MSDLLHPQYLALIRRALLRWYGRNARPMPWRKTKDPYRILVSEIMLQQTQVARVLIKFPQFLKHFPSFRALSSARASDVIRSWQGMGYNSRALNLWKCSKAVIREHGGKLPSDPNILLTLPGIGPYTAHAVACFAFGKPVATVDTNIRRVLSRLFPRAVQTQGEWNVAQRVLPPRSAYSWNQALMELGACICTARNPVCVECPLRLYCPSAFQPASLQVRKKERVGRNGIPNRIYRGGIIEALRSSNRGIPADILAVRAVPGYGTKDHRWFDGLLRKLERDGMVVRRSVRGKVMVSLPE
jgi:A/G-specific adenine glycosylase